MPDIHPILETLRRRRRFVRRSKQALAAATGMSKYTIARYEAGICPTLVKLDRWCAELGLRLTVERAEPPRAASLPSLTDLRSVRG